MAVSLFLNSSGMEFLHAYPSKSNTHVSILNREKLLITDQSGVWLSEIFTDNRIWELKRDDTMKAGEEK